MDRVKLILSIGLLICISCLLYILSIEDEEVKKVKNTVKVIKEKDKAEHIQIINEEPVKFVEDLKDEEIVQKSVIQEIKTPEDDGFVQNINTSDIDIYNLEVEEKTITLFSTIDNKNRYNISLKSSQKITSPSLTGKYIQLNGTIEEDGVKSNFSLSFNEHYKNYIQYSYLEVTNSKSKMTASCDGLFLSGITLEYRYFITLELYGDTLSCYINSQEEDISEKENQLTKDLNITKEKLTPLKEGTLNGFLRINQPQGNNN